MYIDIILHAFFAQQMEYVSTDVTGVQMDGNDDNIVVTPLCWNHRTDIDSIIIATPFSPIGAEPLDDLCFDHLNDLCQKNGLIMIWEEDGNVFMNMMVKIF